MLKLKLGITYKSWYNSELAFLIGPDIWLNMFFYQTTIVRFYIFQKSWVIYGECFIFICSPKVRSIVSLESLGSQKGLVDMARVTDFIITNTKLTLIGHTDIFHNYL